MKTAYYVLAFLLISAWSADAAILCARKDREGNASGAISVRQECRKNEVQLDPAVLGVQPPAVYDATGKKVGDIIDQYGVDAALVLFPRNQYLLRLYVTVEGRFFGEGISLYFESSDCTGMQFMRPSELQPRVPVFFQNGVVFSPGQTIYIPDPQAIPQVVTVRSSLAFGSKDFLCAPASVTDNFIPTISLGDISVLFTPPFTAR
ncbi:MAG: hypothetical protein HYZ50_22265 [Deltaproteobacteria bacterium]|nr:hypothetical protein [Deltaproteobacteria bacterium]